MEDRVLYPIFSWFRRRPAPAPQQQQQP